MSNVDGLIELVCLVRGRVDENAPDPGDAGVAHERAAEPLASYNPL
jgi:hypothetical protein